MIRPDEALEDFHLRSKAKPIPDTDDTPYSRNACLLIWLAAGVISWVPVLWLIHWLLGKALAQAAFDAAAYAL